MKKYILLLVALFGISYTNSVNAATITNTCEYNAKALNGSLLGKVKVNAYDDGTIEYIAPNDEQNSWTISLGDYAINEDFQSECPNYELKCNDYYGDKYYVGCSFDAPYEGETTTTCSYNGSENNETFTITYSVTLNRTGKVTINSIKNTATKTLLENSFVYGSEFIVDGKKIQCPKYLTYSFHKQWTGMPTIKVGFSTSLGFDKKMELTKSTNNNKGFSKVGDYLLNTCSYDNTIGGKIYIEVYTDKTAKLYTSNQYYNDKQVEIKWGLANEKIKQYILDNTTATNCPVIAVGSAYRTTTQKQDIYVSDEAQDVYSADTTPVTISIKTQPGTKMTRTGNDILKEQDPTNSGIAGDGEINWGDSADVTCDGILGEELLDFINKIFTWIKIIAPIAVVLLGSVEFAGAILQDDKDALKKASSKFIKRLIIAVAIFLIPTLLEFILNIFNEFSRHSTGICEIGK